MVQSVSLVIATYNRGAAIDPTLTSVLSQADSLHEVIVVDDGSTDGTADWVTQRFPQVTVIRKENGGTSSARNAGAAMAIGDWLMFLDHDDLLLPGAVVELQRLMREFPEAASVHADHIYDHPAAGVRHENHHATLPAFQRLLDTPTVARRGDARLFGYPLYRALLKGNLLQQPYAIRREVFQQLGGYDEQIRYCEDWDLYLRIAQSFPVAVSDVVISEHRIEGTNLHLTESTKQEVMYQRVLRKRQASHRLLQFQERAIVRRKLAAIFKGQGDRAAQSQSYLDAWKSYFQSFLQRPFDHVVCARLLLWLPKLVGGRGGGG